MLRDELQTKYFNWIYDLVCGYQEYNNLSYRKLLTFLHNTEFYYSVYLDCNREQDGINFRYRFGYENGYSRNIIEKYFGDRPCSVLEMMVALSFRGEEEIMDDSEYGDRTGQWFWNMIVNLGLGSMNDKNFDERYAKFVVARFLNREYECNGKGGLFTIENCGCDMRGIEIWSQFMWYLDTVIEDY